MMNETIASTQYGQIRGYVRDSGIHVFKGIPYGTDTGGKNRFLAPEPPEPWTGIKDTLEYGPACPQPPMSFDSINEYMSEDCLKLNIWTSSLDRAAKRPVMVWLHGGGFTSGSARTALTDGSNLARTGDVVVVSLNHRLSIFGFLCLESVCGPDFADSANAGMLDIVLGLKWVRDNIEAFGGDPGNVTIFGESGGGRKVNIMMGMPSAKGLFHRGIIQSGAHPRGVPKHFADRFARGFFDWLKIKPGDLATLQQIPSKQLFKETARYLRKTEDPQLPVGQAGRWMVLSPVLDGRVLPANPFDPAWDLGADVPLIIGTNKDEMSIFYAGMPNAGEMDDQQLLEKLRPMFGDQTARVIEVHRRKRPEETPWDLFVSITSEDRRLLSVETAERKSKLGGAPVYMYLFTWESNYGLLKAAHTMEIPFTFNNIEKTAIVGTRKDRFQLGMVISQAWVHFARTGNPDHTAIPHWEPYDTENRATMLFDVPCKLEHDPRSEERRLWDDMPVRLPWEGETFVGSRS
ncbi:MAG: carboxylesterase/lipase family protein [Proteobacteria bacterium]|nr:carboxylesterase/lipase family protein [Pseudomonadota bacterium]MBU4471110.1 carboxylesterase/lipase family protein [Pseudomonadota bacterium]MCG2750233.1 carboxylesterase/lipase family protein [Desulfobacteraceae bacterium]